MVHSIGIVQGYTPIYPSVVLATPTQPAVPPLRTPPRKAVKGSHRQKAFVPPRFTRPLELPLSSSPPSSSPPLPSSSSSPSGQLLDSSPPTSPFPSLTPPGPSPVKPTTVTKKATPSSAFRPLRPASSPFAAATVQPPVIAQDERAIKLEIAKLERRCQTLKQAVRYRKEREEGHLEALSAQWKEAGRIAANALWPHLADLHPNAPATDDNPFGGGFDEGPSSWSTTTTDSPLKRVNKRAREDEQQQEDNPFSNWGWNDSSAPAAKKSKSKKGRKGKASSPEADNQSSGFGWGRSYVDTRISQLAAVEERFKEDVDRIVAETGRPQEEVLAEIEQEWEENGRTLSYDANVMTARKSKGGKMADVDAEKEGIDWSLYPTMDSDDDAEMEDDDDESSSEGEEVQLENSQGSSDSSLSLKSTDMPLTSPDLILAFEEEQQEEEEMDLSESQEAEKKKEEQWTIGAFMRRSGIDPDLFGWSDAAADFVDDSEDE